MIANAEPGPELGLEPSINGPSDGRSLDHSTIHRRARRGIKLLMGRQVLVQVFSFAGGIILARTLDPAQFGLFAIATFLVAAFGLFADFGLMPSLIQRREALTEHDLRVGFTLQQSLIAFVVLVLLVFSADLARLYPHAPQETRWLVRALALSLFLNSWRTMSVLQLERQLRYERLAPIEVVEALSYYVVTVVLAIKGFGVWSLVWGTLARGVLGTALTYIAAPWSPRFAFDKRAAKSILLFGIPFQLQGLANQASSWITPLLVGRLLGAHAVGLLTWASSLGKKPLVFVDNIMRVAFSHFSRLQDQREEVERTLVRYLTWLLLMAGLWSVTLATAGRLLVALIYTAKWLPAVSSLVLFSVALSLDVVAWVVAVALNSTGRLHYTTRITVARSVAMVLLSVPLVISIGYVGIPLAALLSSVCTIPLLFRGLGPGTLRRVVLSLSWIVLPGLFATVVGFSVRLGVSSQVPAAILTVLAVTSTYATTALFFAPAWLRDASFRSVFQRPGAGT